MGASQNFNISLNINANAQSAEKQLQNLQKQLQQISNMKVDIGVGNMAADIEKASEAAMKLSAHLATATNPQTGNLDFTKFYSSIQKSGASLQEYGAALSKMGPTGQKAFVSLADSISKSEIPLKRTSTLVNKMWDGLKRTAGWQVQSSIIHGIIGGVQQAVGYAKDLNKSLTDIRIVTGQSTDQMAKFAKEANKAAKNLSTTTTDYTRASLIYYQQGLSEAEVKARTETTIKMANATGTSAQKVSDQMTAIWNNYDNGTKSLTHYADVMTALGAATASSTDEIAQGLQKFASISNTVGLSYEYAASALATITAESRESADVVGNALKTLFSRIQGLQLGETLDDGTTLNKYSTALAKVGISIKDQAGGLKDMDDILDEMGSKWDTLARDEKMALAQTVAGVRQYTQLMTLMENWDDFKQNLNTANTSTGTLDRQAAIYAQSWEAASDRVRASWEGLWDNLISSEGFITILDGLSGIVSFLDQMVTGLGGAGGAFLTFGGILTKVFNKQIASGLSDFAYTMKMLMPGSEKAMIAERNSFIQTARNMVGVDTELMLGKSYEAQALRAGMKTQLDSSLLYSRVRENLTPFQRITDQVLSQQVEDAKDALLTSSQDLDSANKKRSDFFTSLYKKNWEDNFLERTDNLPNGHSYDDAFMSSGRSIQAWREYAGRQTAVLDKELATLQQQEAELKSRYSSEQWDKKQLSEMDNIKYARLKNQMGSLQDRRGYLANAGGMINPQTQQFAAPKNYSIGLQRQATSLANLQKTLGTIGTIGENFDIKGEAGIRLTDALTEFSLTATHNMGGHKFMKTLNDFVSGGNVSAEQVNSYLSPESVQAFAQDSMSQLLGSVYDRLSGDQAFLDQAGDRQSFISKGTAAYLDVAQGKNTNDSNFQNFLATSLKRAEQLEDAEKPQLSGAQRLVSGASGAMQAAAAGESIKGLVTSFQSGTATISSTLTGLSSSFFQATSGFAGLQTALTGLGGLSAGAAGGIALAATAILALAGTVAELWDQAHISAEEMKTNLINSNNELTSASQTAAENAENTKAVNEDYLDGVKKIKSFSQDPATLAQDIYESNKKALNLITEYGLSTDDYKINSDGLIEINESTLSDQETTAENNATTTEHAEIVGTAMNNLALANQDIQQITSDLSTVMAIESEDHGPWREATDAELEDLYDEGFELEDLIAMGVKDRDGNWTDQARTQNRKNVTSYDAIDAWNSGNWETFKAQTYGIHDSGWAQIEDMLKNELDVAENEKAGSEAAVSNAAMTTANQILSQQGINVNNQDAYLAYQKAAANEIEKIYADPNNKVFDGNDITKQSEVVKLLEQQGIKNVDTSSFRVDSGVVYYKVDGETEERQITGDTLNALYAANQIDPSAIVASADAAWEVAQQKYATGSKNFQEAAFFMEQFGNVKGASVDGAISLLNGEFEGDDLWSNWSAGNAEYDSVTNVKSGLEALGLYKNGQSTDVAATESLTLGAMENLMASMTAAGDEDLSEFSKLMPALSSLKGKDLAGALTAISALDFKDNSYENLQNISQILNAFGADISLDELLELQGVLENLGAGTAENLAETNTELTKGATLLNNISEQSTMDAETAAEMQKYFGSQYFVKNAEGGYTFTGTKEMIDQARSNQNAEFAKNQENINKAQDTYKNLTNMSKSYDDVALLGQDLGLEDNYTGDGSTKALYGTGNSNYQLLLKQLGPDVMRQLRSSDAEERQAALDAVNNFLANGGMTESEQSAGAADYMATFTSAADLSAAVQEAQARGDTAGFVDANGVISDEALGVLKALPATSERAAGALDTLSDAQEKYKETGEGADIVQQALDQYNLETSIDAVAAARGIDAEAIAAKLEYMKQESDLTEFSAQQQAELAARYVEVDEGLDALKANYSSLSQTLQTCNEGSNEWNKAIVAIKQSLAKISGLNINQISTAFIKAAQSSGLLERAINNDEEALFELTSELGLYSAIMDKVTDENQELALQEAFKTGGMDGMITKLQEFEGVVGEDFAAAATSWNQTIEEFKTFSPEELLNNEVFQARAGQWVKTLGTTMGYAMNTLSGFSKAAQAAGFEMTMEPIGAADLEGIQNSGSGEILWQSTGEHGEGKLVGSAEVTPEAVSSGSMQLYRLKFNPLDGSGNSGGGGGGGGPKKVANKRKSQTVKRYKKNDSRRSSVQSAKKSASTQKDYLYGESKIAQMEKINKLAEKEARITSDRIKESRKYLVEDRENLIKYMQKYGYEAEFDSDGFLENYEEAWTQIHDKIAKLYEDNELTADEQKLEEDYKVELEELEGALEDYENSLKELQADIEAYEESLYEMYDNKVEQMQHKVEFRIELNEDDLSYLDFWIEALGDSLYNALESLQTMGQKTNILFSGIETYKQGIEDIYALSDDPLHTWATGGLDEVLTQDQVDALRENRDGLMDYMQQLLELRSTIQDQVLETFDKWQEKLNTTMSTIEHYGKVLDHFKNIIDIVGKDTLGLTDGFMSQLQQSAVDQSMDSIEASRAHYESLVSQNATAQAELEAARARGDEKSAEHWEKVVKQTTAEMQSAQDQLLSSLESTLQMIADQFESAMTRAVDAFNDAIYANGGLQGLQDDYSFMREQADLMAEDYDKIYQLSKLNRNINKLMNDSSIIAGKQKMKSLQQEINELQASGVELSKYDLDYLQAKYDLRVAELELENAKNNKDTVRLSRDSEGNWSYVYTASVDKIDEAQQKYEDALYAMQNLSYEYMDEMSNAMMQTSLAMMEEIQALRIQDFESYDAYAAEIERIQNKYASVLQNQENELNKSMGNNADLYNQDWLAYSQATGYKISANQDWVDNYYETTMGMLMGSNDATSGFSNLIGGLTNTLLGDLGTAAINYFANVETAMNKYGSSIAGFGAQVTSTVSNISTQSKTAAADMKQMAEEMNQAFKDITDYVSNWQAEFGEQIDNMLTEIGELIQQINEAIRTSAELSGGKGGAGELIGTKDAIKLLNENGTLGTFEEGENGSIIVNGKTYSNWLDYNGQFIEAIDQKLAEYAQAELGSEQRAQLGEELKELFAKYQAFKAIVARIYDPTSQSTLDLGNANYSSFATGGYTGEWGDSGRFAMLHEKELILNQNDTKNFLDALDISRDVINSMIELNAKQSSMGFGELFPATFKDSIQSLEQQVSIVAEFPNAQDHNEIEEAFNNLINQASQYANRYKI